MIFFIIDFLRNEKCLLVVVRLCCDVLVEMQALRSVFLMPLTIELNCKTGLNLVFLVVLDNFERMVTFC